MATWRKPGKTNHAAACANCHGPDGYELALYGFSDEDLRRRAKPHLADADAEDLVRLIHAIRRAHHLDKLLDPQADRPFQPGGQVLPGKTPEERDRAFGEEIAPMLPSLAKGRILGLSQAKDAASEIMAINPWTLKVGIPLNRLSEDAFHGNEHASIASWIADEPRQPLPGREGEWYGLQDTYLAAPTDANFWKLYEAYDRLTAQTGVFNMNDLSSAKQKALFLYQHLARTGRLEPAHDRPPILFGDQPSTLVPNPIWDVGNLARDFIPGDAGSLGFSEDLQLKKTHGPTVERQLQDLRLSWLYVGWLMDQGLYRTSYDKRVRRGEWLQTSLWQDGPYAIHNLFVTARRQLVLSWSPQVWSGEPTRRHLVWDFAQFMLGFHHLKDRPTEPTHRERYDTLTANCFRMSLWLLLDDLNTQHVVWLRDPSRTHVKGMLEFLNRVDPVWATQDRALVDRVLSAIDASTERT